jgi:hypothetical protein
MPTAPTRAKRARHLVPLTLLVALALTLAIAGTALAETKIGEGTSPENPSLPGEVDLLKGSIEYDVAAGGLTASFTTRTAPESTPESERPEVEYIVAAFHFEYPCSLEGIVEAQKAAEAEGKSFMAPFPAFEAFTFNRPLPEPPPPFPVASAYTSLQNKGFILSEPENLAAASKAVSGTSLTISGTNAAAANYQFNCSEVVSMVSGETDVLFFPLSAKPEPPPAQTTPPAAQQQPPAPAVVPGVLSIAKAKKPLKLKVGKSRTVTVKVTNTGGSTTVPGSLRLKAAKGVVVTPKSQKLPALLPGNSWTVSYKVKLTAKAKKSSTLSLVGASGSLSAKGSLVVKLAG